MKVRLFCDVSCGGRCGQSLNGVVDIHVALRSGQHGPLDRRDRRRPSSPSSRGMRGLVLKNHYEPTAALAYLVQQGGSGNRALRRNRR